MKNVTIKGQDVKVTKKYIKEVLQLERNLSYYSAHAQNPVAIVTQYGSGEDTIADTVDAIYATFDQLVKQYEAECLTSEQYDAAMDAAHEAMCLMHAAHSVR